MLNQSNKLKYLIGLQALIVCLLAELSPLQIDSYDISLVVNFNLADSYDLKVKAQSTESLDVIVCFQQLEIISKQSQKSCYLQSTSSEYKCVRLYSVSSTLPNQNWLKQSFNFSIGQNLTTTSQNISTSSSPLQQVLTMTDLLNFNMIYHMISASSKSNLINGQWKQSFAHTYSIDSYRNTLIMQRNVNCARYNNKVSLTFEGGVIRDSFPTFFVAILTIDISYTNFSMWGGYSFSSDHACRDMIGYQSVYGQIFDLYSIYASAPFEDVLHNVKGTDDITQICSSRTGNPDFPQNYYYFTQFYRVYDTKDIYGDEIIRQKINNKFCSVAYFTNDIDQQPLPTNKNLMHQLIECHVPNIQIFDYQLLFCFSTILLMILFIF